MESTKEITLYIDGLLEVDREKLLSVLVLAEIRLESSWVLETQLERADVCLCRQDDWQKMGHFRPLICYTDVNSAAEFRAEDGVFILSMDSSGVPTFSELVSVFNQADAWLEKHAEQALPSAPDMPVEASAPDMPVKDIANIPMLTQVIDPPREQSPVKPNTEGSNNLELTGQDTSRKYIPWLGAIAEYIHNLDSDSYYHKILIQSGEVVLLDFEEGRFYSSSEIENFLKDDSLSKNSYMSSIDKEGLKSELSKKKYIERPLSNLLWFLALYSNMHNLKIDTENTVFRLSGWPSVNLPGLRPDHLKLAAFMRTNRANLIEIAMETGMHVDQVKAFVEACHYEGLIVIQNKNNEEKQKGAQKPSSGLWGRVLRRIKR